MDNLTPEHRRKNMQAIRDRDTSLEKLVAQAFRCKGWRYRRNYDSLPGKPDFVFIKAKVVVFVDGDFWHGWQFPRWEQKLSDYWREKIAGNRRRDQSHLRRLRRAGWKVIRIWGHELKRDSSGAINRVMLLLEQVPIMSAPGRGLIQGL